MIDDRRVTDIATGFDARGDRCAPTVREAGLLAREVRLRRRHSGFFAGMLIGILVTALGTMFAEVVAFDSLVQQAAKNYSQSWAWTVVDFFGMSVAIALVIREYRKRERAARGGQLG